MQGLVVPVVQGMSGRGGAFGGGPVGAMGRGMQGMVVMVGRAVTVV